MVKFEDAYNYISNDWMETLKFVVLISIIGFIPILGQLFILGLTLKLLSNVINGKNKMGSRRIRWPKET